jgi:hypothetical protein
MTQFTITCPHCSAENSLTARRLLARVDAETATSGEVLFTCLICRATATVTLDVAAVAVLLGAGVTHLSLSAPTVEHPEERPSGPPLTHDDLIDLHAALEDDRWPARLSALDC